MQSVADWQKDHVLDPMFLKTSPLFLNSCMSFHRQFRELLPMWQWSWHLSEKLRNGCSQVPKSLLFSLVWPFTPIRRSNFWTCDQVNLFRKQLPLTTWHCHPKTAKINLLEFLKLLNPTDPPGTWMPPRCCSTPRSNHLRWRSSQCRPCNMF